MAIDRTLVPLQLQLGIGASDPDKIEGKVAIASNFAVTDDSDTTAAIYVGGTIPWEIVNESGGAATLTFTHALTLNGTSLAKTDEDSVATTVITLADDGSQQMPSSLSGVLYLVITAASPASGFTLICKR